MTPEQPWDDPRDIAVCTVEEVAPGQRPALRVVRDAGLGNGVGGWQFYDGEPLNDRKPVAIAKEDLLNIDPSLKEITNLPVGWEATRDGVGQPWIRVKLDQMEAE